MKSILALLMAVVVFQGPQGQSPRRTVAITIDDLPTVSVLGEDLARARATTNAIVSALQRHKAPATGFVNERKLARSGAVDPERVALLRRWIDAGLDLGNHTFSHIDLHGGDVGAFLEDAARGERVTRQLLTEAGRPLVFFRHPFLRTGRSAEVRREVEAWLKGRGYRVAPVTVDNSDYVFAAAYERARADAARIETTYLDYMEAVVAYYEQQSTVIVGREIPQILLMHANALNGATLDRLLPRLRARGYAFVTLDEALKDPAFGLPDEYYGAGGISWLHRWALTAGKRGIFAGEPAVPEWIQRAANGGN